MLIKLDLATYNEAHSRVNANGGRQFWADGIVVEAELIFDLDAMTVCDIFHPNWFSGDASVCFGYGYYGTPENTSFEYFKGAGMNEELL